MIELDGRSLMNRKKEAALLDMVEQNDKPSEMDVALWW